MASHPPKADPPLGSELLRSPGLLRRSDQRLLAGLIVGGGLALAFWWISHGGPRGELVELGKGKPLQARFLVDVNSAEWPELSQLPEIGETLARRIVAERQASGPFLCPEDLMKVHGIGPKTVDLLLPFLDPESWPADSPCKALSVPAPSGVE